MAMITKCDEKTDPRYGKAPEERTLAELLERGIVIVDKPPGPASHEVTSWVKKALGSRKAGHSGTLDPNVSGVLPVGLGKSTRILPFITQKGKEYVGIISFRRQVPEDEVRKLFVKFTGEIEQMPPLQSAVRRRLRKRKVYYLNPLQFKGKRALFTVGCEAGTYIRTLCEDIGKNCGGALMLELRRTKVGGIGEERCVTMQGIADAAWLWKNKVEEKALRAILKPIESAVELEHIVLRDSAVDAVCAGATLNLPGIAAASEKIRPGDNVALFTQKGELVAVAKALMGSAEIASQKKGAVAKPAATIMERGTYPKCW